MHAISPDRDALEIRFPRVEGYRTELPQDILRADFTENSRLQLDPSLVGASETKNSGIIGEAVDMTLEDLASERMSTILFKLTNHVMNRFLAEPGVPPPTHLFHPLKRIVRQWMDEYLTCAGQTYPAQVLYQVIADMAGERIHSALVRATLETGKVKVILDAYKRYTEALASQRAFIAQGNKLHRDENAYLERVGTDLVDKAYMAEVPDRLANPQTPDDFDAIAFVTRQWAKQKTAWCRR